MNIKSWLTALTLFVCSASMSFAEETPKQAAMRAVMAFCNAETLDLDGVSLKLHTISSGQNFGTLARDHAPDGTGGRCLSRINEDVLAPAYLSRCKDIRRNLLDDGYYCNDAKANENFPAWANTLNVGDEVYIIENLITTTSVTQPSSGLSGTITRDINVAIADITGKKIVLVVDVSGSMDDESDQAKVLELYGALLNTRLAGVVFYSQYAHFTSADELNTGDIFASWNRSLTGNSSDEHVMTALELARNSSADAIVLIADEPGVDTGGWGFKRALRKLPPVTAHCLESIECSNVFKVIANETGGMTPGQS